MNDTESMHNENIKLLKETFPVDQEASMDLKMNTIKLMMAVFQDEELSGMVKGFVRELATEGLYEVAVYGPQVLLSKAVDKLNIAAYQQGHYDAMNNQPARHPYQDSDIVTVAEQEEMKRAKED